MRNSFLILIVAILLTTTLALAQTGLSAGDCTADVPMNTPIFNHHPIDPSLVTNEIFPLGNLNLRVRPLYRMDLPYVIPGAASTYLIKAMAAGRLKSIETNRDTPSSPWTSFRVEIDHSCSVQVMVRYLDTLNLANFNLSLLQIGNEGPEDDTTATWARWSRNDDDPPILISANETIGTVSNFSPGRYLSLGVRDSRFFNGTIVNAHENLNPEEGLLTSNIMVSSRRFYDYMNVTMAGLWTAKLPSLNQSGGQTNVDVPGTLQGTWYNPSFPNPRPLNYHNPELEAAALSIVPDSQNASKYIIKWHRRIDPNHDGSNLAIRDLAQLSPGNYYSGSPPGMTPPVPPQPNYNDTAWPVCNTNPYNLDCERDGKRPVGHSESYERVFSVTPGNRTRTFSASNHLMHIDPNPALFSSLNDANPIFACYNLTYMGATPSGPGLVQDYLIATNYGSNILTQELAKEELKVKYYPVARPYNPSFPNETACDSFNFTYVEFSPSMKTFSRKRANTQGLLTAPTDLTKVREVGPPGMAERNSLGSIMRRSHMVQFENCTPSATDNCDRSVHAMETGNVNFILVMNMGSDTEYDIYMTNYSGDQNQHKRTSIFSRIPVLPTSADPLDPFAPNFSTALNSYYRINIVDGSIVPGSLAGEGAWLIPFNYTFTAQNYTNAPMTITQGKKIGTVTLPAVGSQRDYRFDVAVADNRMLDGSYVNASTYRYPHFVDIMASLLPSSFDSSDLVEKLKNSANHNLYGQCLKYYLQGPLEQPGTAAHTWESKEFTKCMPGGVDRPGKLMGVWFHKDVDRTTAKPIFGAAETGSIAFVPLDYDGNNFIHIAFGMSPDMPEGMPSGANLAQLDPELWSLDPCVPVGGESTDQANHRCNLDLSKPFKPAGYSPSWVGYTNKISPTSNGITMSYNFNPAEISTHPTAVNCFQFTRPGGAGYRSMIYTHMPSPNVLNVIYLPTVENTYSCHTYLNPPPPTPANPGKWKQFVR